MKRILVADDSVTIQKVITLTFADEPFDVQSVGTGAEALELVKSWKPDIVLADVIMPQMNGYELCRAVKQQTEPGSIPVLLLAGTFEAFDEAEAKSVGADDFITKPFESGELIEKVNKLIGPATQAPAAPVAPETSGDITERDQPATAAAPPAAPEAPPAPAPTPTPATEISEPDIWDILSDSGDQSPVQASESGAPAPGFGPIEDTGVVDVGSFDVGIGRPESPPAPAQAPEPVTMPAGPDAAPEEPVPAMDGTGMGAPPSQAPERSQVENREKDFFGFETGAVEELPATEFFEEAVEEVTFEMEPPTAAPATDAQEVSFVVPEPAGEQPPVTGETIFPHLMAPDQPPAPEPGPAPETAPVPPIPAAEWLESQAEPSPGIPVDREITAPGLPEPETVPEPVPAAQTSVDESIQPDPEPPLELSVDLTTDLPEGFSPEPAPEAPAEVPGEDTVQAAAQGYDLPDRAGVPDDDVIRKIIEEKVEKIAWEVVPEMAEVIIREAIQKIKDGS